MSATRCGGRSGIAIRSSTRHGPVADEAATSRDVIELVVQVNGKLRGHVSVGADADREAVEREAQRNDNVARFIGGKPVRKVIVVPGRLVNIVV